MKKLPVTHKDTYLKIVIQLFNELYLKNAWSYFHAILHHCTVIKDISAHQLFNEQLAELSAILDSFHQHHKCLHKGGWLGVVGVTD